MTRPPKRLYCVIDSWGWTSPYYADRRHMLRDAFVHVSQRPAAAPYRIATYELVSVEPVKRGRGKGGG